MGLACARKDVKLLELGQEEVLQQIGSLVLGLCVYDSSWFVVSAVLKGLESVAAWEWSSNPYLVVS
jgi:hypothetical protein